MNPNTHNRLLKGFINITFLILILAFMAGFFEICDFLTVLKFCGIWLIYIFVSGLMLIYLMPVQCDKPGCMGRMRPGWASQDAQYQFCWRLFYICGSCGEVHDSSFTFSVGLGEPY